MYDRFYKSSAKKEALARFLLLHIQEVCAKLPILILNINLTEAVTLDNERQIPYNVE
ncbi:MAG: hypothetical protein LBO72_06840 [Helicobacteraceae bacterium]|nr:hypothetical protein [Helicobacteraceae bacterium]